MATPYYVKALLFDNEPRWNSDKPLGTSVSVTYSFLTSNPGDSKDSSFVAFDENQRKVIGQILQYWAEVANITFTPTQQGTEGQVRFGMSATIGGQGLSAGAPGPSLTNYTWIQPYWSDRNHVDAWDGRFGTTNGKYLRELVLHEVGHAIGLNHPGPYNFGGKEDPEAYSKNPDKYLPKREDNAQYSIMSYNDGLNGRIQYTGSEASSTTPLIYDIAAAQYLYGANYGTRTGDDTYSFEDPNAPFRITLWDAGGNDTISAANQVLDAYIDLRNGYFSSIGPRSNFNKTRARDNLAITFEVKNSAGIVVNIIENAVGGKGDDVVIGNEVANSLFGGEGNDILEGRKGNDTLDGGSGRDRMTGGEDDDTYYVDNINDTVTEYGNSGDYNGGIDTVNSSIDYVLGDNLEKLTLISNSATNGKGNSLNNIITGNDSDNILSGEAGNDTLNGGGGNDKLIGGVGSDLLDGGTGSDIASYSTSSAGVIVNLVTGQATGGDAEGDRLVSIENLEGSNSTDSLTGDNQDNYMWGLGGNDTLNGLNGDDKMFGGGGDDKLIGGTGADLLNGGDDFDTASYITALSGIVANLSNSQQNTGDAQGDIFISIENLEGSQYSDVLTGSGQNNHIWGLGGDDYLNGIGGNAILEGGLDNDTYRISNLGTQIVEYFNQGTDTVNTSIDYTLVANLENLNLLESTAAFNGTGNELNNIITGNSADNTLNGAAGNDVLYGNLGTDTLNGGDGDDWLFGGKGNDILTGGSGNDMFAYTDITDAGDMIMDFTVGSDKIVITDVLKKSGYGGSNPRPAHYLSVRPLNAGLTSVQFDPDGLGNSFRPAPFILLKNVQASSLDSNSFIFA